MEDPLNVAGPGKTPRSLDGPAAFYTLVTKSTSTGSILLKSTKSTVWSIDSVDPTVDFFANVYEASAQANSTCLCH